MENNTVGNTAFPTGKTNTNQREKENNYNERLNKRAIHGRNRSI